MKITNQNNNLLTTMIIDDPKDDYIHTMKDICIPMIYRFDRLMFVFKDMNDNIIHLNGEFELQLTIEDCVWSITYFSSIHKPIQYDRSVW